jgi:hypothetical protein
MKRYYYDKKHTIWEKTYLPDNIDIEQVKEELNRTDSVNSIKKIENKIEYEILYDTMEGMVPEDNGGETTIELFEDDGNVLRGKVIWSNKPTEDLFETLFNKLKP